MSDAKKEREVNVKGKLVMKDLGNPKKAAALDENDKTQIFLGTVLGHASGISVRTGENGEAFEGLKGKFRGIPGDPTLPIVESGILYLHSGMFEMIAANFRQEDPPENVEFALEIYTQRATNKAGYEYAFKSLKQPEVADPLSALEASLEIKQLPAPKKSTAKEKAA